MKKNLIKILLILFTVIILIFLFIKVNTKFYIGDYSWGTRYSFDITLKIDDREVLNDSLHFSNPGWPEFEIKEKLRYGLHKISINSNRANVYQEQKIFLLPNQHIYIEFFPADTLTYRHYHFPDSIIINGIQLPDSVIEQYKLPKELDLSIENEQSGFWIASRFNPFYTE
jgi:hypothetical protein